MAYLLHFPLSILSVIKYLQLIQRLGFFSFKDEVGENNKDSNEKIMIIIFLYYNLIIQVDLECY